MHLVEKLADPTALSFNPLPRLAGYAYKGIPKLMETMKSEPLDDPGLGSGNDNNNVTGSGSTDHVGNVSYLQRLIAPDNPPELLEQGVSIGVRVLGNVKKALADAPAQTSAPRWLSSISELEALAKPTRTIVGVVGNTGAGKSSVISAVLDEERYLYSNFLVAP